MTDFNNLSFADLIALRDEAKEKAKWVRISLEQAPNTVEPYKTACSELIADYEALYHAAQTEIDEQVSKLVAQRNKEKEKE